MSEETSTSNIPAAGASSEDIFLLSTAMESVYSSSTSSLTQTFHFSSRNPRIEETRGIVHLFRNDVTSSTASDLPHSEQADYRNFDLLKEQLIDVEITTADMLKEIVFLFHNKAVMEPIFCPLYAVVTGANKGIGFGICKQLASNGITVVLTSRNEERGVEAVEKFKEFGLFDNVVFHQLDVTDPSSVRSLAEFVRTRFGRLDILVNNAGIGGVEADDEALRSSGIAGGIGGSPEKWSKILIETYDLAVDCLQTNYHGVKRMVETFIPLLQLSKSPRIVNVSSSMGQLKNIPNEWAKGVLRDAESLTEEKVDDIVNEFLKDFKEGCHKDKGWPPFMPAYIMSKANDVDFLG